MRRARDHPLLRLSDRRISWTRVDRRGVSAGPAGSGGGLLVSARLHETEDLCATAAPFPLGLVIDEAEAVLALDATERAVLRCRALGWTPVLADAGVGFAALSELHGLPWGLVWLADGAPATVAGALADLARGEGAEVVVSGVDDDAGLREARAVGAHHVAGALAHQAAAGA